MNIVSDQKSIPGGSLLSPEANAAAAFAAATATASGVLTVDLDAIVANWRKLEKTAVPVECAAVILRCAVLVGSKQGPALSASFCAPVGACCRLRKQAFPPNPAGRIPLSHDAVREKGPTPRIVIRGRVRLPNNN